MAAGVRSAESGRAGPGGAAGRWRDSQSQGAARAPRRGRLPTGRPTGQHVPGAFDELADAVTSGGTASGWQLARSLAAPMTAPRQLPTASTPWLRAAPLRRLPTEAAELQHGVSGDLSRQLAAAAAEPSPRAEARRARAESPPWARSPDRQRRSCGVGFSPSRRGGQPLPHGAPADHAAAVAAARRALVAAADALARLDQPRNAQAGAQDAPVLSGVQRARAGAGAAGLTVAAGGAELAAGARSGSAGGAADGSGDGIDDERSAAPRRSVAARSVARPNCSAADADALEARLCRLAARLCEPEPRL